MGNVKCSELELGDSQLCCANWGPDLTEPGTGLILWPPALVASYPADSLDGSLGVAPAILYLFLLLWTFLGVATVSDVFMSAIEVITSKEKEVKIKGENGEDRTVRVKMWNDTVANLTLMALGSSAPEILLSIIELLGNDWFAGELGPSTVVGSAAFNLFVISAVCVYSIPEGEIRYIIGTKVYSITAFFSVFAYLWLLIILLGPSKDRVEIWEGLVTFLYFPFLVTLAYCIDVDMCFTKKRQAGGHVLYAMDEQGKGVSPERLAAIRKEIREEYMHTLPEDAIMKMVVHRIEQQKPKSRAEYRIKATREMVGGKKLESHINEKLYEVTEIDLKPGAENTPFIGFASNKYACLECCVSIRLMVERTHSTVPCSVAYETLNGEGEHAAKAGEDYVYQKGMLEFAIGETRKEIEVKIVDDTAFEEDEQFYVQLSSPQCEKPLQLNDHARCTVTIIDDDEPGQFQFTEDVYTVVEGPDVEAVLTVERKNGSSGTVTCQFYTEDGSAKGGEDFDTAKGELVFKHSETNKQVRVKIIDDEKYEKKENFKVHLTDATGGAKFTKKTQGGEEAAEAMVYIVNDEKTKGAVDAIAKHLALEMDGHRVGFGSYSDQFKAAFYCNGSPEEAAEVGWISGGMLLHCLNFPWKMFFAFIPPTDFLDGKLCFVCALSAIGLVTAIVGDLANLLGCSVGMPPDITAITFVALGTSLPDTFASKAAAVQDPYADASIGNVTGSNSVNVFLGLGLPWTMGAIYWNVNFDVAAIPAILKGSDPDGDTPTGAWMLRTMAAEGGGTSNFYAEFYDTGRYMTGGFMVPAGGLGPSVLVFCALAVTCLFYLYIRRLLYKGELGGPLRSKKIGATILVSFWLVYVMASIFMSPGAKKKGWV